MAIDLKTYLDMIGENNASNAADTTKVTSDDDGSVLERLEWIMSMTVLARGTFTTSSTSVPADTSRTEANDYWNGTLIMPISGSAAFQPRLIVDFANTGGVFTIDPDQLYTAAPGLVEYVILSHKELLTPATDGTNNYTPAATIGSKADTADYTYDATTSSIVRLLKGVLGADVIEEGTFTTSSTTVPADTTIGAAYTVHDYFKGCVLMPVTGSAAFQPRPIGAYTGTTGVFTLDEPFTTAPSTVAYVILRAQYPVQKLYDIFTIVNAVLALKETGGTVTTDGTEQTVYIVNSPYGVWEPRYFLIDFTNQTVTESVTLRVYSRIASGGSLIKRDEQVFAGTQSPLLKSIELHPNRFGMKITIEKTDGTNRAYLWSTHYEE